MISPLQMRAMRLSVQEKLATRDVHGREYEEMSKAKWKQFGKDLPIVMLGTGLGYGTGKLLAEQAVKHMGGTRPGTRQFLNQVLPLAATTISSVGSYAFGRQQALMRQRRAEAERRAQASKRVKKAGVPQDWDAPKYLKYLDRDEARKATLELIQKKLQKGAA